MKPRQTTFLDVVDRLVVILLAFALVAAGVAILAIAFELFGPPPDLTRIAETATAQLEAWPAAAVIAIAAVVTILGAVFSIRHLLPANQQQTVSELRLPSGEGRHRTEVRGRALSTVVEEDLGHLSSVRGSSARLVSADPPALDVKVTTSLSCDLKALREHVTGVVDRLDLALGRSDVRMRVRIGFVDATSESRVE